MALVQRPSPKGKRVSLFITCIMDMIYPNSGIAVLDLLEHLQIEVDFPEAQTCCGQPGFNAGYRGDAATVAKHFLTVFENAEVIVTASGSCAAMVRHEYPTLFKDDPEWAARAQHAAAITWEITEYFVEGLGIEDLGLHLPQPQTITLHDACHGLRLLGLGKASRTLLSHMGNATVHELTECEMCCGFGGLFSVKMPEVSGAMLNYKIEHINASPADTVVTGDASCLMHINGGLSRQQSPKRVKHIVDVLAEGLPNKKRP